MVDVMTEELVCIYCGYEFEGEEGNPCPKNHPEMDAWTTTKKARDDAKADYEG